MSMISSVLIALALAVAAADEQATQTQTARLLVAYDSRTGFTEELARAVAEGARSIDGITVDAVAMGDVEDADIVAASAIVVGSPVHWSGVSAATRGFLERVGNALVEAKELGPGSTSPMRLAGAFVTGGAVSSGKDLARVAILSAFLNMQFVVVGGTETDGFGTLGAQATTGESDPGVSAAERDEARRFGARCARVLARLVR